MSAYEAAAQAIRKYAAVHTDETIAGVIESVQLLSPAPDDTVLFRVRGDTWTMEELNEALRPLRERYPEVLFVAAEVESVSVMRPLTEVKGDGK